MNNKSKFQITSQLAVQAMLFEVTLSPTPGLVDRFDSGSHHDMDINTFIKSSLALAPFYLDYITIGYQFNGDPEQLFHELRQRGICAETAMFEATSGINTHKGANFTFALTLGALGLFYQTYPEKMNSVLKSTDTGLILEYIQKMTAQSMEEDLHKIRRKDRNKMTHGEKLFIDYGFKGIRGQSQMGYPIVKQILMPWLRHAQHLDMDTEETLLRGLVLLMSQVEDGNLIHRGGIEAWLKVKADSQAVIDGDLDRKSFYKWLETYNTKLINLHLSPGGSADLLALGIFLATLEGLF